MSRTISLSIIGTTDTHCGDGKKRCHFVGHFGDNLNCMAFDKRLDMDPGCVEPKRLPQCIAAESGHIGQMADPGQVMNKKRVEFGGHVHLMSAIQACEYSLCGVAFYAADSEQDESLRFKPTKKRTVDCPQCALEIENCRHVQTATTGVSSC